MKINYLKILEVFILLIILIFLSAFVNAAETTNEELISINFRDVELETALIMLANTAEKNLICDSSVQGKLTVIFNDIVFKDALNLITSSFDLDYSFKNNIIYVSTKEKIVEREENIISKNYKFNNISTERAAKILKNNFEELKIINLNSEGLIINSKKSQFPKIEKVISKIDKGQKQVLINAKVVEISRTKVKDLGIDPLQLTELKFIKDKSGKIDKLQASWPDTLKLLSEKGLSNILANPSLMTLDRKEAKLVIGDQIPVKLEKVEEEKTISTINYIEAGIVLEFFPKILNEKQMILEIKPSVNSLGQILSDGLPAVNSRSAETTVILENNETLAIGGLIKKDELKTIKEVPILADLPILGSLFRSTNKQDIETELLIFITPKIIESKLNNKINIKNDFNKNRNEYKKQKNTYKKKKAFAEVADKNKGNKEFIGLTEKELEEILNK